jgi:hypothetical protein
LHSNKSKLLGVSLFSLTIRVMTQVLNSEQSNKGKVKTHKYINKQNQSTMENCENHNDPDPDLDQILKRQTSRFHYGSKVPVVTITVFITILEQNR